MKFGKQLEVNTVAEWREYYVQYKQLKRVIKRVAFHTEHHSLTHQKAEIGIDVDRGESAPLLLKSTKKKSGAESRVGRSDSLDDEKNAKQDFWNKLESNLHTINEFFKGEIATYWTRLSDFEQRRLIGSAEGHVHSDSENGFQVLQEIFDHLVELRTFVQMNFSGFRKIVKKYDKVTKSITCAEFVKRLEGEYFYKSKDIDHLCTRLYSITSRDKLESGNIEKRMKQKHGSQDIILRKVKLLPFCISTMLFVFLLLVRITPPEDESNRQQKCLALLVFVTSLWVTEALPYFATALFVPCLVVFLRILNDPADPTAVLTSQKAAKEVMTLLVNHTTILIMGGYSISAAFAKCQIELYIAAFLQNKFKKQPRVFLLAIMLMGLFLSMWISNHTAPVLCVSVLLPIIRDFSTKSAFAKTLLIGLAFACNLGGMMTPIASLQNTLAVQYLGNAGYFVSFGQWMTIAVPFCTIATVLCWGFLLVMMDPQDVTFIPQIVYDQKRQVNRVHLLVIALTLVTIGLWATFSLSSMVFGDLGIISMLFMFIMFSTGILSQFDFNSFSWHILFLIGGGNVLGEAVKRSGLLSTLSNSVVKALPEGNVWLTTICLCCIVLCLTTFVSHTVASIILMPIIVDLSIQIGHPHIPVICCALSISAAMALPFSSFPNINSLLVLDDHGGPYLQVIDFLKVGLIFSVFTVVLIVSLGYGLIILVMGYHHKQISI